MQSLSVASENTAAPSDQDAVIDPITALQDSIGRCNSLLWRMALDRPTLSYYSGLKESTNKFATFEVELLALYASFVEVYTNAIIGLACIWVYIISFQYCASILHSNTISLLSYYTTLPILTSFTILTTYNKSPLYINCWQNLATWTHIPQYNFYAIRNHTSTLSPFTITTITATATLVPYIDITIAIDDLSLAMFEALRGLRDAVAPTTVTGAPASSSSSSHPVATTSNVSHDDDNDNDDSALVQQLATRVLEASRHLEQQVMHGIPGMERTRSEQMRILQDLLVEQQQAQEDLHQAMERAMQQRAQCRHFLLHVATHPALNM
jgi:hypothetical protein